MIISEAEEDNSEKFRFRKKINIITTRSLWQR